MTYNKNLHVINAPISIHTVIIGNTTWFILKDLAIAMGYSSPNGIISTLLLDIHEENTRQEWVRNHRNNHKNRSWLVNKAGAIELLQSRPSRINTELVQNWIKSLDRL